MSLAREALAIVKRHGGKFLTRGHAVTTLEGESFTERLVLIEFSDRAHAEAFYNDSDYHVASNHTETAGLRGGGSYEGLGHHNSCRHCRA